MITLKCKSCGDNIPVDSHKSSVVCPSCGNKYDVPMDEKKEQYLNLYSRADDAWDHKDFEEASELYQQILNSDNTQAEAHFGLVLCKYGITYEIDPITQKKMPTCNRINRDSILDDKHFQSAIKYASKEAAASFQKRAQEIDRISRDFLRIVDKEPPYDVFISYKRTAEDGSITQDSKVARKLYFHLKEKGFKIFFAEETLKSIAGEKYEPYIFAALSSAPVMILVGSKREHFDATWVKNEWRRYLVLMNQGLKKTLIPSYFEMDPYHMPGELRNLQAMNAADFTFHEDITEIIRKKVADAKEVGFDASNIKFQSPSNNVSVTTNSLLRRAKMFLEDGDWSKVEEYCNQVLDIDPENALSYFYLLLAQYRIRTAEELSNINEILDYNQYYKRAIQFADEKLKRELEKCNSIINKRIGNQNKRIQELDHKRSVVLEEIANAERKKKQIEETHQIIVNDISSHNTSLSELKRSIEQNKEKFKKAQIEKTTQTRPWWFLIMIPSFLCFAIVVFLGFAIDMQLPQNVKDAMNLVYNFIDQRQLQFIILYVTGAIGIISTVIYFDLYGEKNLFISFFTSGIVNVIAYFVVLIIINNPIRWIGEMISSFFGLFGTVDFFEEGTGTISFMIISAINYIVAFVMRCILVSSRKQAKKEVKRLSKSIQLDEKSYNTAVNSDSKLILLQNKLNENELLYKREVSHWQNKITELYNDYVGTAKKYSLVFTPIVIPEWVTRSNYTMPTAETSSRYRQQVIATSQPSSNTHRQNDASSNNKVTLAQIKVLEERNNAARTVVSELQAERDALVAQKNKLLDQIKEQKVTTTNNNNFSFICWSCGSRIEIDTSQKIAVCRRCGSRRLVCDIINEYNAMKQEENQNEALQSDKKNIAKNTGEYCLVLIDAGRSKLDMIKFIREITGLSLKQSMELVDNVPTTIRTYASKDEVEETKQIMEKYGATVEIALGK